MASDVGKFGVGAVGIGPVVRNLVKGGACSS